MIKLAVAAIDIGTTHSGWACSFRHNFECDPLKISTKGWNCSYFISQKAPSCVLIRPDGKTLDLFGSDAEYKYVNLAKDENQWYFFQRFKTTLFNEIGIERNMLLEDSSGKKLHAKKVLTLTIQYLKNDVYQALEKSIGGGGLEANDIHWVFTVPAITNVAAEQFFREAAVDAGVPRQNLSIVSEPQAASVYCRYHTPEKCVGRDKTSLTELKIGRKYIVLDAGGTGTKFTVHEIINENNVRELLSSRIECGSTSVDEAFEDFLREIFGKAVISEIKERFRYYYLDLLLDFELKKREYHINKSIYSICFPRRALDDLLDSKGNSMKECVKTSRYQDCVTVVGDKLRINAKVMRYFYESAVTNIIRHVESLLRNPVLSGCSAIVMVGGFSDSKLLQERIQEKFSGLKVVIPEDAVLAVLKGAVILGHDPLALNVERTEVSMQSLMQSLDETKTGQPNYRMERKPRASDQSGHVTRTARYAPRDKMDRKPRAPMQSYNATRASLPCYKMDRKPRGWCIIINIETFDNIKARTGTHHDKARLLEVFGSLHFIVVCYDNLTSTEIMKQLVNTSHNIDHTSFDCFVCCILSHGSLGHVYGSDNKAVPIKEITSAFNAYRCPTLAGKPKLFFMQACQGKEFMQGATAIETDSFREEYIPSEADFLYGFATVPGHVAYRHTESGSWYMRALCETLKELHDSCHLLEILTEVNRKVAEESAEQHGGIYKQIPAPQNTLRKKIYFR